MARANKTLAKILRGTADANIDFNDLCRLLRVLGFDERIRGSHHIFTRTGVEDILQPTAEKGISQAVSSETSSQHDFAIQTRRRR